MNWLLYLTLRYCERSSETSPGRNLEILCVASRFLSITKFWPFVIQADDSPPRENDIQVEPLADNGSPRENHIQAEPHVDNGSLPKENHVQAEPLDTDL